MSSDVTLSGVIEENETGFYAVLKAGPFSTSKEADMSVAVMFAHINDILSKVRQPENAARTVEPSTDNEVVVS